MPPAVGRSLARVDGRDKVTGRALYLDDLHFPGLLHGTTVRAPIASGELVDRQVLFDTSGFIQVDYTDVPAGGKNLVSCIDMDQPALVERIVRHPEEPVLLFAHESRERLLEVHRGVKLVFAETEPVFDPRRSPRSFKDILIEKGDLDAGFSQAELVLEGEYSTGAQEHVYIENHAVVAVPEPDGGMTVYGSLQCPYYVHKALYVLLGLPPEKVRVVQTETGGGFGGKEDYPSIISAHAALLARKAGRPVKIAYDRQEDMVATTKRHPAIVRHRTGFQRDGTLVCSDVDVLMDGGAYCTLSPVVLSRGCIHAAGAYRIPHVRIRGRAAMTNTPPNGAFRGFGAPQTLFAVEVHLDRIAESLGMDPVALRRKNALRPGDTTATGQTLGEDSSAHECLEVAVARSGYFEKKAAGKGMGVALFLHGAGFTGAGEVKLASVVAVETCARGANVRVASTEIGQGTRTILAQLCADAMDIPFADVEVSAADTAKVPDSGPTVASRTCMVVGGLVQRAARELSERLGGLHPRAHFELHGRTEAFAQYEKPPEIVWDDALYKGDAYGTYAWGCDVAEVEVDPVTYEVKPVRLTCVQEIGKVVNPMLAAGQIEGGTAQAVGWAVSEEVVMRNGRMANGQLTNYIIPTSMDAPMFDTVMLENPYTRGPHGAKGVGELPMDGGASAVINALRSLGYDLRDIPATPERVAAAGKVG